MWNISDSSRGCIKSIRMHSTYVRAWGEGVGHDPCGWGVTLVGGVRGWGVTLVGGVEGVGM